jgi:hypothetical protein
VAAEGQLPSDLDPTRPSRYADATGPKGVFATFDYGDTDDELELYLGHPVTLEELKISPDQLRPRVKKVALQQARCPQCNGTLELRAPDQTKRVGCPFCGALLDASQGKLEFLQALGKPEHEPDVPLGAKGTLDGVEWTCLAYLIRSCEVEGDTYFWREYLLWAPKRGFRWLVESTGHWLFLTPIAAGDVQLTPLRRAQYQGRSYKCFQATHARTEYVLGECYWEVSQGETARTAEYVCPPYSLNTDATADEVTFSHGAYLPREELAKAFKLDAGKLPRPTGIAPSQPNRARESAREAGMWSTLWAGLSFVIFLIAYALASRELVLHQEVQLQSGAVSGAPESMFFSQPLELKGSGNVQVKLWSPVQNDYLGVEGDLVEESGEVTSFYLEAGYWSGRDSDGAWSEGSVDDTEYLSQVPAGRYTLRLTPIFEGPPKERQYRITLTRDVPRALYLILTWIGLAAWPLLRWIQSRSFEQRRWEESYIDGSAG